MVFPITHSAISPLPDRWDTSPTHVNRAYPFNNDYEVDDLIKVYPFHINMGYIDRDTRLQIVEYMATYSRDWWTLRLGYVEPLPYHTATLAGYVFFFDASDAAMFKLAFGGI